MQKSNPNLDDKDIEKIIDETIEKIQIKNNIKNINKIFDFLKNEELDDIQQLIHICNFLKIDYNCVVTLKNTNFSYNQAINMIWYFSDNTNSQGYKIITYKKIKELFPLIEHVKQSNEEYINDFELYDLIGIYKSQLYDSRSEILLRLNGYICKTIRSLCSSYGIVINSNNYEDFYSEIKLNVLNAVEKSNLNIIGQIFKYIDLNVKGYFRLYLKKYVKGKNSLSLDDKGTKKEKSRIDCIAYSKNLYEKVEDASFSSDMMKVLLSLSPDDLLFIILKFQENYSNDDLASYSNLTLEKIEQKELEILSLLKNNDNVKSLIKVRNN